MQVTIICWAIEDGLVALASLGIPSKASCAELRETFARVGLKVVVKTDGTGAVLGHAAADAGVPVVPILAVLVRGAEALAGDMVEILR